MNRFYKLKQKYKYRKSIGNIISLKAVNTNANQNQVIYLKDKMDIKGKSRDIKSK
jgi:hypothetical protein